MKIAIHIPQKLPFSIQNYIDNILKQLDNSLKIYKFCSFTDAEKINKKIDIFWFPYCAGGSTPSLRFLKILKNKKFVITLHGVAPFSLSLRNYYSSLKAALKGEILKYTFFIKWQIYKQLANKIITVSNFSKYELINKLKIPSNKIYPIYHGVDTNLFRPNNKKEFKNEEFFLHISQYQPKKNVDRIIEAYKKLSNPKPKFILIVSGYQKTVNDDNIILIKKAKETIELVGLYQKALVFVFPSLHEAFGMPILEAMACGCPVITSNITSCAEIAGEAALLVNPYSVDEISNAMRKIMESPELREDLSKKGLERVKQFTWEKSAKEHLKVFEMVLKE